MTTNNTSIQENEKQTSVHRREIKSFVRREGRTTPAQERALNELLSVYGIDYSTEQQLDFAHVFGNTNPVWLEIGFGMGQSLASMAETMPDINFLGIEVHRPGVGSLLNAVQEKKLTNIRVMSHDAVEVLKNMIAENSLARLLLFFPDPWHKTRHHKRRIVQAEFMSLVASCLNVGGAFHAATDWEPYAQWMMEVMNTHPDYQNPAGTGNFSVKPNYRPETKFERRGQRLGHGVWDLIYIKK